MLVRGQTGSAAFVAVSRQKGKVQWVCSREDFSTASPETGAQFLTIFQSILQHATTHTGTITHFAMVEL